MSHTQEFLTKFYSLTGETVGERRKNLFLLLNSIDSFQNEIDVSLLKPRNQLEERFWIDVLVRFRKVKELFEIFKSENPILIQRILKISWLFNEIAKLITGDQLVTVIFPFISFNAKVKLANRLSCVLTENQADEFFQALEKKYGLYLASKVFAACSPDVILDSLKTKRMKLSEAQMLSIVKRRPELAGKLLDLMKEKEVRPSQYKETFEWLAQNDVPLYFKFVKKYNLRMKFGRRKTHKFVQKNKENVIKNPEEYCQLLHVKKIAKTLNKDFARMYENLFPRTLKQLNYNDKVFTLFNDLPVKICDVGLLDCIFKKRYKTSFWENHFYVRQSHWEKLSASRREKLITPENRPNNIQEDTWMSLMKTSISVPYLKKAISLTSDISTRSQLIKLLVKTCKINSDETSLLHLCKYMLTKHRNDNPAVRRAFLGNIKDQFKLESLSQAHWDALQELIQLFKLNDESFDNESVFLERYIHFRLKNNLPIKDQLIEWMKSTGYNFCIVRNDPEYEKYCLMTCGELIPQIFEKEMAEDEDILTTYDMRNLHFARALQCWNERHPKDQISIFDYSHIVDSLKGAINKDKWNVEGIIKSCLHMKYDLEQRQELLNLYLSHCENVNFEFVKRLLTLEPSLIFSNIERLAELALNECFRKDYYFWKWWRNHEHLDSYSKVVNLSLAKFESKKAESATYELVFLNSLTSLAFLMTSEDFLKFIAPYYPEELRVEVNAKQDEVLYAIQKKIADVLLNIRPSSLALESILIFCKGDYLKLVQKSLYSVCSNVNEDKLPLFLNTLSERAVSTRKHALHLTLRNLDKEQIFSVLKKFMDTEKNPSLRKFIFKGVFNFFVLNPDDYTWELAKINVKSVDVNDKEALEILMQVEKIPANYIISYVTFTWEVLDKLPITKSDKESHKGRLIRAIPIQLIVNFPEEFCNALFKKYFFKLGEDSLTFFNGEVHRFAVRHIVFCESATEKNNRLKLRFESVKSYIAAMWNIKKTREGARNCVSSFVKEFCLIFLTDMSKDLVILETFTELWNGIFQPCQVFNEYLHLRFTHFFVEKLSLPDFGRKVAQLFDSLAETFGYAIVYLFYKKIDFLDRYFFSNDNWEDDSYTFIESLMTSAKSHSCLALVIKLFDKYKAVLPTNIKKYYAMIEKLERVDDPVVKLYLENYFKGDTALDYQ